MFYNLNTRPSGGRLDTHYVIADGDAAVTFEACKAGTGPYGAHQLQETQFNGAMMIAWRGCLKLTVVTGGKRYEATLHLGVTRCPEQSRR